ncbi:oligosaccharide flippase family protein [Streptococcaceae bacterium ESL0687]|nr:oligosaccharide flippase family protein [Streptococcaceae bacterium ESL0687]
MSKKIKGVNILIISSLIGKILSALYRFPYQNIVGDLGFYAYQQVYPFYAIVTCLSLTALPNFLSSLLNTSEKPDEVRGQFFQVTLFLSVTAFVVLSLFSLPLAKAMGTKDLAGPLISSVLPLLLVPFLSLYRGVNQSKLDMQTTAISQLLEQLVRVSMIILAATSFISFNKDVYLVSSLAMLGSFFAGLVALSYLMLKSNLEIKTLFNSFWKISDKVKIIREFGLSSLVFVFFMIYMLIFQLIDVFTVKDSLVASGYSSSQAEILKGIYDRGQPFLQLGLVFVTSIFTNALPKLSLKKDDNYLKTIFDLVIYLSITLTVGLCLLLPQMNVVLFKSNSQSEALIIFSSQVALVGIIQFYHHLLFLEGKNKVSALVLLIGLVVKLGLTSPLTKSFGLSGASSSSFISLLLVLVLYILISRKFPKQLFNFKYLISLALMVLVIYFGSEMFHVEHRLLQALKVLLIITGSALVFLISCKKLKAFPKSLWDEINL